MRNFLKHFIPIFRRAARPSGDPSPETLPNNLPFDPLEYLSKEGSLDRFLKLIISPVIFASGYFTYRFLENLFGFTSLEAKIGAVVIAAGLTGGEMYGFRTFKLEKDYRGLFLALVVAITSVWGSLGAFQIGVEENTLQSDSYQLSRKKIEQLDKQIDELNRQLTHFRKSKQPGNINKTAKRLTEAQTKRDEAMGELESIQVSGAGKGNAAFKAVARMTGWDTQDVAAGANGIFSAVIELFLIFITIRNTEQEKKRRRQDIVLASRFYHQSIPVNLTAPAPQDTRQETTAIPERVQRENTPGTTVENSPNRVNNVDTLTQNSSAEIDLDNMSPERVVEIVACVLRKGQHPEGTRHAGAWRFSAAKRELGNISRQGVQIIFNRHWTNRTDDQIVSQVVERLKQDQPDITDTELESILTGQAAPVRTQNGRGAV